MPHLTQPLGPDGALIEVLISLRAANRRSLQAAGQAVPGPLTARAQLDTGATFSCLDLSLPQALSLSPAGTIQLSTPSPSGALQTYDLYDINLGLVHPNMNLHLDLSIPGAPLAHLGYEVLLGRDVLAHCLLVYDGRAASFALAF